MKIGLFIPCYVDALYPEVGVATYKLLTSLGLDVTYPLKQTCCGQPMANSGFEKMATDIVRHFDDIFREFDYVVAPSASCAAFVKLYHPRLAKGNHECLTSKKIMDVVEFLHDVVKSTSLKAHFPHIVSVHNSCHGVRELHLSSPSERQEPQFNKIIDLLKLVDGITIREPERKDECCGFGGMFSLKSLTCRNAWERTRLNVTWLREPNTSPVPTRRASCTCRALQRRRISLLNSYTW